MKLIIDLKNYNDPCKHLNIYYEDHKNEVLKSKIKLGFEFKVGEKIEWL